MTNPGLETKRYEALMESLDGLKDGLKDLKVSHAINIQSKAESTPDGVLRWGIWTLVVTNMASLILLVYLGFFHG